MPKTINSVWEQVYSFENLLLAFKKASKKKRYRREVLAFQSNLEENLINIQNSLIWRTWKPSSWRRFFVYEPKQRVIDAPPFCDRVVHHALVNVIEPYFERRFIGNSYACRTGKGTLAASDCLTRQLRAMQRPDKATYALKADISKYFPSISHDALRRIVRRTIKDDGVLWLFDTLILESDFDIKGLPIGALTSQLFANINLDFFDHYMTDELGVPTYVRYMDDFIVLSHDKKALHKLQSHVGVWLEHELGLQLNPKTGVFPVSQGIDFCGYRHWTTHKLARKRNVKRARKKFKGLSRLYRKGKVPLDKVKQVVTSFTGYMSHCNGVTSCGSALQYLTLTKGV